MNNLAIGAQVKRMDGGMDGQAILGDLIEKHDPAEKAGLAALYNLIGSREWDRAMDMCERLIMADRKENVAHLEARAALHVLTGQVSA